MSDFLNRLFDLLVQIQQIPAPTFEEAQRAQFVFEQFKTEGLPDVSMDSVGNVYARWPGQGTGQPLIVSAHLDTVFPLDTDLTATREAERILGPGIGDNSLGVASLFGLLWLLRDRQISLPGDIWLVANVCEEGLGDLRGMRAVVERFGADVLAYLVVEGLSLGYIQHRALGVQRYHITVTTEGGHSWSDYGRPSAIHALSALVTELTSMQLPLEPRTTLNVGRMGGGTSVNVIAAEAWLELDLRSESPGALAVLVRDVERLMKTASRPGVRFDAELIGQRPAGALEISHPLISLADDCLREQGFQSLLTVGSTDANIPLSQHIPALVLGVTTGAGAHTTGEFIYTELVMRGMEQLVQFVSRAWKV